MAFNVETATKRKTKTFRLHLNTVELVEELAAAHGSTQSKTVEAIINYAAPALLKEAKRRKK
jgi:hypothetical protein